jgi:hypothetical protein
MAIQITQGPSATEITLRGNPSQAKSVIPLHLFDRQTRYIRLRLQALERNKLSLEWHQKWPTQKAVDAHYKQRLGEPTDPGQACSTSTELNIKELLKSVEEYRRLLNPDFPFPFNKPAALKTFTKFCLLPPEIRLQIWETAFDLPRFIEAQFITESHSPVFINSESAHVLLGVCRESREIAQAFKAKRRGWHRAKRLAVRQHPRYHPL